MIGAIVLAAGESRRMGKPKALLSLGGRTFVEVIVETAREAGVEHMVVVGRRSDPLKTLVNKNIGHATWAVTTDLRAGPIGSIRAGLERAVNWPVEGVVVWHVDRPRVTADTIRRLAAAFEAARGRIQIVVPRFAGRRGHPVLFGRRVFAELARAGPPEGAREVVRRDPGRVLHLDVPDAAVLEDVDTPEAYRALVERHGRSGRG